MATINNWNNTVSAAATTLNGGTVSIGTDNAANAISIGVGTIARAIGIGNSAAAHVITVGSTTGAAQLALQTGTADFTLASATGTIMSALDTGEITYPLKPAFLAYLNSTDSNRTGNATVFTVGSGTALTEIFDQGSNFVTTGTFTAPVTGKYQLNGLVRLIGCATTNTLQIFINTSNFSYLNNDVRASSSVATSTCYSVLADMDTADTAILQVAGFGETGDTDDLDGVLKSNIFSGFLAI